jgi:hypothetical protein
MKTHKPRPDARPIPDAYRSILAGLFQTLGDMDQKLAVFEGDIAPVGVFMSDTGLFQRTFPDGTYRVGDKLAGDLLRAHMRTKRHALEPEESKALCAQVETDHDAMMAFEESLSFPLFYGLALPLLKYGLPIRPLQLDNLRDFPGCLDAYQHIVLSYEFMKPKSPDINNSLAEWVRSGGVLIYVGDGADPYHKIRAWWNQGLANYNNPAEHLFAMLGLPRELEDGVYTVGLGKVAVMNACPALFCLDDERAKVYRETVRGILAQSRVNWIYSNHLTLRRGPYVVSASMDESLPEDVVFHGSYADIYSPTYELLREKRLKPGENTLLFDLSYCKENGRIIGTQARIERLDARDGLVIHCRAAAEVNAHIRVYLEKAVSRAEAIDEDNKAVPVELQWDEATHTVLLAFRGTAKDVTITARA